jgi:hypothetical protein
MIQVIRGKAEPINQRDALRYLGYRKADVPPEEVGALLQSCAEEMLSVVDRRAVMESYPVTLSGDDIDLGFAKVHSHSLALNLAGCDGITLFAATVGANVDRLILKYERLSPAKGAMMQALGAAVVEDWCDEINERITKQCAYGTKPRFSCGYGDLDLGLQRDIFAALSVTKNIGITLNDNLFMTPTKSVTAIVGRKVKDI